MMKWKCIFLGGACLGLCLSTMAKPAVERSNVLFIAIDDLNDWIGCFGGNPQVQTPHLDRFNASGGMVMFDAHGSSTVCGPSRSSLLTGKYPHTTGVYGNKNNLRKAEKSKDLLTLPQYFSAHGYHTLSRGKFFINILLRVIKIIVIRLITGSGRLMSGCMSGVG